MLDATARKIIDPPLNWAGQWLARRGITANAVTLFGLFFGLVSAAMIALGYALWALVPLVLSRVGDGLDGAVARASKRTDFGGYLDVSCDFLFYGAIPMAFVLVDPTRNAAAGAFLLTSFYFNGATFLGYAVLAEKRGLSTKTQGLKSLYFSNGLLEGTETIAFFVLLCLLPSWFAPLAWIFGTLCFATGILRLYAASRIFVD